MAEPLVQLVVARADAPGLVGRVQRLAARGSVVLLTDDRETIPPTGNVAMLEPEELVPHGVVEIDRDWDQAVKDWLTRMFPGQTENIPLSDLLWVNVFRQPLLLQRMTAAAVSDALYQRFVPGSVFCFGEPPDHCSLVAGEARRLGIPVHEQAGASAKRRILGALRLPVGLLFAASLVVRNGVRLLSLVSRRRRVDRKLAALRKDWPAQGGPRFWLALSPAWIQPVRHLIDAVIRPAEENGIPYGILFEMGYGIKKGKGDRASDELSLFDGTIARCRTAAISQTTGTSQLGGLFRLLATWLPLAISSSIRVIRCCDQFRVRGRAASGVSDMFSLLRIAVSDLLRVLDASLATQNRIRAQPAIENTVIFSMASFGEAKVADRLLQKQGATTIDFAHGYVSEAILRTTWRSESSYLAAWTEEQARWFEEMGTNRTCVGGYLPRSVTPRRLSTGQPRILVIANYVPQPGYWRNATHARRLAATLGILERHLQGRAALRVRLHPLDDPTRWSSYFGGQVAPSLSRAKSLGEDLADADLLIGTISSAVVEALLYGLPILMHRGPIIESKTLFAYVAEERWFRTGDELAEKVDALLGRPADLAPEKRLLERCFGPQKEPKPLWSLLHEIGAFS